MAARDEPAAAAREWLALLDAGEYRACWERAARLMRGAVSPGQLAQSLRSVLAPLGDSLTRTLDGADYHETLPRRPRRPLLGHAVLSLLRAQEGGRGDGHSHVGRRRVARERLLHPVALA